LRSFWNRLSAEAAQSALVPGGIDVISDTLTQDVFDVELEYARQLELGVPQNVAVGVGYRFKSIQDWAWLDDDHRQHHFSAYLQDILEIADPLRVQLSFRADRHPLLDGVQLSPRGSIVYRPTEGSAVRGTVGYAFRSPTFLESYLELANPTPVRGVLAYGIGNTELEPERITSFELGYAISESDYFALEANVYYNLVDNLILFTDVHRVTLDEIARGERYSGYDGAAAAFPVSTLAFENEEDATFRQLGGEVGVRVFPVTGLDLYANYAYHGTSPTEEGVVQGERADEQRTSAHKLNVGVQ
jgi:iron complex outermembrane receptor protein